MRWVLLLDPPEPGWRNMALDAGLLDLAAARRGDTAYLRLYGWAPHCLSFGRHEPTRTRYHTDRIRSLGLDCVRRPTGGRAVWHARELTYAVAAPLSALGDGGLKAAYHRIHEMLAAALRLLGAGAELAPAPERHPGPAAGPCFAAPVGGEVLVQGRKVIGSAQLRHEHAFLQHGSILLDDDQSLPRSLARGNGTGTPAGDAALSQLLGRTVSFEAAAAAVALAAAAALGGLERPAGRPDDVLQAAAPHEERFRSAEWTWQR